MIFSFVEESSDIIQDILSEFFNSNLFYSQQLRPSSYGVPSDYSPSISLAVSQSEARFAFSNATQIFIGKSDDSHMSIDRGYNLSDIVYNDPGSAAAMGRQAEVLTFWFGEPDNVLSFHRDGKIFEWNAGGCREVGSPVSETNTLLLSKFSSDGRFLITASRDGALKKWDVKQKSYVSTFRDSTILNRYLKKIVFSKNGGRMIKILSNKLQLWNMFADTALRVHPEAIYAQMATFSHDGQHMLVFDSYNTLYLFDSLGRRKASMKISFPNSGESSYDFLNAGIYDLVLSPDWKKLLIKHGSRYVMYSNANPNDPLVRIGENLSYKIDSNLRSRRLTALPYPAVEAFFADDQTIISMDGLGFISRWEIKNNFNNVGQAFSDIKQITAETYQEKENNSLLRFDQVIKSKNLDTLKSAAAFYYQKSRTDTIDLAPQNLQKAKKLYETLLKIDTASFLQKSYYNSLLIFNDELYALERPKRNRDYRFMIECIKQNVDFLEQELKRQPLNSILKKRLSDYYWPMSFYQLFISSENQGAINSALRGLELYPLNDGINTNLALGYFLTGEYDKADSIYRKFKDAYYSSRVGDGFRNAFIGDFKALERDGVIRIDNPEIYNRMMYIRKEILGEK